MKTYRIGVIGLGQRIAHVLAAMKEVGWKLEVAAQTDPAPVGAPILAEAGIEMGVDCPNVAALLARGPYDLVMIGSPNHLHFEHLSQALDAGWPVFAENGGRWGLDVQENDNDIVVRAEAPGFEPEDFDLQVRGNQLVLRAAKQAETEEKDRGFRQWQQREFYQAVPLPADINPDKVDARYRNGVLTVTLPKTEQSKAKRIQIKG